VQGEYRQNITRFYALNEKNAMPLVDGPEYPNRAAGLTIAA